MDLRSGFDQILEVSPSQEVSKVDKFAVVLILNWNNRLVFVKKTSLDWTNPTIHNTPAILSAADLLASNNNGLFRANNSERDHILSASQSRISDNPTWSFLTLI